MEYCVLSHRWGASSTAHNLTSSNIDQYKRAIAVAQLPKSFRDAIAITRSLHIPYLWIDSLCIIQDSREDWERESQKMDSVFEGSTCTIAAAGAEDSDQGCFSDRDPLSISKCRLKGTPWYICSGKDSILDIQEATKVTPLSHRGWIFQERLLSPRTLSFGKRGIFWHCARGAATEQDPEGWGLIGDYSAYVDKIFGPNAQTSGWKPWPQGFTFQSRNFLEGLKTRSWTKWNEIPDARSAYCFHRDWMSIVEAYSSCTLTKSADKLAALSGIVNRIDQCESAPSLRQYYMPYLTGAWTPIIILDILWYSTPPADEEPLSNDIFPCWSWASVHGQVRSAILSGIPAEVIIAALENPSASLQRIKLVNGKHALVIEGTLMTAHISSDRQSVNITYRQQILSMQCFIDWPRGTEDTCHFVPTFLEPGVWLGLLVASAGPGSAGLWRRVGVAVTTGIHCSRVQQLQRREIVII